MIILIAALAASSTIGFYALHLAHSISHDTTAQQSDGFEFATL